MRLSIVLFGLLILLVLSSAVVAGVASDLYPSSRLRRVAGIVLLTAGLALGGEIAVGFGAILIGCGFGGGNLCGLWGFIVAPLGCVLGAGCAIWISYRKRRAQAPL